MHYYKIYTKMKVTYNQHYDLNLVALLYWKCPSGLNTIQIVLGSLYEILASLVKFTVEF